MRVFWRDVIRPLLKASGARAIVEVGAERGLLTRDLAAFARRRGATLHCIDPHPLFDVEAYRDEFGFAFAFHHERSLRALPEIGPVDVALVDGDHNWFTVLSELRTLAAASVRADRALPIVVLHDVGWPYGRRDLYYEPTAIPPEARHEHARGGLKPGHEELVARGLNDHLVHAAHEGGARNGVLTAVEDFLAERDEAIRLVRLDGLHGLGILLPEARLAERKALRRFAKRLESKRFLRSRLEAVESDRLGHAMESQRAQRLRRRLVVRDRELAATAEQLLNSERQLARQTRDRRAAAVELERLAVEVHELEEAVHRAQEARAALAGEREWLQAELAEVEHLLGRERLRHEAALRDAAVAASARDSALAERDAARLEARDIGARGDDRLRDAAAARRDLEAQRLAVERLLDRVAGERREAAGAARRVSESRSWRWGHGFFLTLRRLRPGRVRTESALDVLVERLERPLPRPMPRERREGGGAGAREAGDDDRSPSATASSSLTAEAVAALSGAARVSVVVPIHNAPDDVRRCVEAVARNTTAPAELVLIDDASTDARIGELLDLYAGLDGVRVLRNAENVGFTGTANRGLRETAGDVVLLNSDTEVGPRWLEGLRAAAYSAGDVGSVTAVSDNAGAFAVPDVGLPNAVPPGLSKDDVARLVAQTSARLRPETPTAGGFCMYLKRAMVEALGDLDVEHFPRGYGEENDYSMRARAAGWRHLVDDATFVHHRREASFGAEKERLLKAGREAVDRLHPDYADAVRRFVRSPAMEEVRARVRFAFDHEAAARPRPRVLFVVHEGGGGTPATNMDLMAGLGAGYDCLLLTSDARTVRLWSPGTTPLELASWKLDRPWRVTDFDRPDLRQIAIDVLVSHSIELVHVRHLFKHSLDLPAAARALGIPVVVSLHDFYLACPSVHLLDEHDSYCGGECTPGDGPCRIPSELLADTPPLKHVWIRTWRERVGAVLEGADALVTTSEHAAAVYRRAYPGLEHPIEVIEHGRDIEAGQGAWKTPRNGAPARILVPGNIGVHKGVELIARVAALDAAGRLEFHFLGRVPAEFAHVGVHHGPYEREEFAARAAEIDPVVVGIFSIWPETYCHTLTEAWSAGIPVVATDMGALGERVRRHGGGWLVPHDDPAALYERLVGIVSDRPGVESVAAQVAAIEPRGIAAMAADYDALYRRVIQARRPVAALPETAAAPALTRSLTRLAALVPGSPGREPGSTHVRVLRRLAHPGVSWRVRTDRPALENVLGGPAAQDAVLVQRTAVPPEAARLLADRVRRSGVPLILELDDDLLRLRGDAEYAPHVPAIERLLEAASLVTVSTPHLQVAVSAHAANVAVVPNALDELLWFGPSDDVSEPVEPAGDRSLRLLYMGTRTHARDLALLAPVVAKLRDEAGVDVRLEVVGGEPPGPGQGWYHRVDVPGDCTVYPRFVRWLRSQAGRWDVAVAPLEGSSFNASKSDLKLLEYAALGLPGVYSAVEAYRGCRHGVHGLTVANEVDAWVEAIAGLAADGALRERIARSAADYVRAERCLDRDASRYLDLLCRTAGR